MQERNDSVQDVNSPLDRFDLIDKEDFSALKLRYLELTSLFEINKILNSTLELRSILDNVLLTPMGRLMIGKGMVLLVDLSNLIRVANVKGGATQLLGQCYSLPVFPDHALLLDNHHLPQDRFFQEMQRNQIKILVPLIASGKSLGLLAYGKKFSNEEFTQEDVDFLESLANLAAIAVDKSLLFEEIKSTNKKLDKKIQELHTLFEISRELNASLDQTQITQILSFAIMGELLINKCIVLVETEGKFRLEVAKGMGASKQEIDFSACRIPLLEMFATGQHYIILEDEMVHPEYGAICNTLTRNGIIYLIPMFSKDHIKGMIGIGKKITDEVVTQEELSFLETLGNDAMIAIENANFVKEMLEKQRMEDELNIAREIQKNLLPQQLPVLPGVDVAGKNISSYQVGGDYYDCIQLNDHLFGIAIADVSGKSTPAALLMANLQASLRALANEHHTVVETIVQINRIICQNTSSDKFITFFYCILDTQQRSLTFTNAGHNPPYLLRLDGTLHQLSKGGLILGLFKDAPYESEVIELQDGDCIYLFTDGVTETMNEQQQEFGEKRLEELLVQVRQKSAAEIIAAVEKAITAFANGTQQSDDITMVVARVV